MTAREVIQIIEADGWYAVKSKGGHRQYRHPVKKGRVTVPVHGSKDLSPRP
jgi:predicted RNA binding protein YcfA (HicA-like mRNA interferase family)